MDSIIRVWDLPTGHLIDAFRIPSTCTALSMSSTGEYLATTHADGVGINIWTNRSLFIPISTKNVDEDDIANAQEPTASGESGVGLIEAAFSEDREQDESEGPILSTEQLSQDMMTLSVVPKSKWQTLLHLDVVKVGSHPLFMYLRFLTVAQERNRPKEPSQAPQKAPFFLPSLPGTPVSHGNAGSGSSAEDMAAERSRVSKIQRSSDSNTVESPFTALLRTGHLSGDFEPFVEHMKCLPPTKVDLEIRSLNPQGQDGHSELSDFVTAMTSRLRLRKDFELVNAWMAVFLRIHSDIVEMCCGRARQHIMLAKALMDWNQEQQQEGERLAELVGYCRGVIGFLRSSR